MPKLPGVNHLAAVRAFERAGFRVLRQSGHIVMGRGRDRLVIPRNNPINSMTMGGLVRQAGLTVEQFKRLL